MSICHILYHNLKVTKYYADQNYYLNQDGKQIGSETAIPHLIRIINSMA